MLKKILLSIMISAGLLTTSFAQAENCNTSTILGAIVGGVLANHLSTGKGGGKDAATGLGALLGGSVGNDNCQDTQKFNKQINSANSQHIVAYPTYGGLYRMPNCQVRATVIPDAYGGYYTHWQEICF